MAHTWPDTRPIYYGTAAERAAFPAGGEAAGALFFDYDDETWYYYDGAAWQALVAGGSAPANAEYLTLALAAGLSDERVFVDGVALTGTDGGAGGNYTLDLDIPSLADEAAADDADTIAIYDDTAAAHKEQTRADFLAGAGYPYDVVSIDLTIPYADYASLETAFSTEGASKEYRLGPGTYALVATPLPATSRLCSEVGVGVYGYSRVTGYSAGGVTYGLPTDGTGDVEDVHIEATADGGVDDAIGFQHQGGWLIRCLTIASVIGGGVGDAIGVDVATPVTGYIKGGEVIATGGAVSYAVRVNAGATVFLQEIPTLSGDDGFFTGAGTIAGVFQDTDANLYYVDGVANSAVPIQLGPGGLDLQGVADALILDADADTTISAPTDDQIDFEVGGADILRLIATALKSQGSTFPDLGTTTLAEKWGNIYQAPAKEIYPNADTQGLFSRAAYGMGFAAGSAEDDFDAAALAGWTWAGAPFVTPGTVDLATYPSVLLIRFPGGVPNRAFLYKAADSTSRQIRGNITPAGAGDYVGYRWDDGSDNNYYEMRLRCQSTAGIWEVVNAYRTGGGAVSTAAAFTLHLPSWYILRSVLNGTFWTNWGVYSELATDAPGAFVHATGALFGATWTATRRGPVFYSGSATWATFYVDWVK